MGGLTPTPTVQSPAAYVRNTLFAQTTQEDAANAAIVRYLPTIEIDITRYGAVGDDQTDCADAFDAAVAVAVEHGGAIVRVPPGIYQTSRPIELYNGVRLLGHASNGTQVTASTIRYVGGDFVDVISPVDNTQSDSIEVAYLRILGGAFQAGTARYGFYAEQWHRGCDIHHCIIRDCYGTIKIEHGYYGHCHHNLVGLVTPTQAAGGATDAEFAEVYGSTSAPLYLGEMNSSNCQHMVLQQLVSEHGTGAKCTQAVFLSGTPVDCRHWTLETTGVDYSTFSPRCEYLIVNDGLTNLDGLYCEAVAADSYAFRSRRDAITMLRDTFLYNITAATLFRNESQGDMFVSGYAYRAYCNTAWFASSSNIGAGGDVIVDGVFQWRAGEKLTDAGFSADADNVYDTFGTDHPYGAVDGTDLRFHRSRVCFPRVVTGLTVSKSSDANGPYIQVTGGVLLNERGKFVNTKFRTGAVSTGLQSCQRLRPNVVSKFYRVYVGKLGNIYLVESAAAFTDATGDWLADFPTDGAGAIGTVTANPRLAIRGEYLGGGGASIASTAHRQNFAAGDTSPSVSSGSYFRTANSGATVITTFDDGVLGQEITVEINDNNTTIDFTGTTLKGNGGADWTPASGDMMRCIFNGTNWLCSIHDCT